MRELSSALVSALKQAQEKVKEGQYLVKQLRLGPDSTADLTESMRAIQRVIDDAEAN